VPYFINKVSTRVLRLADILAEDNCIPTANQKTVAKKIVAAEVSSKAKI
jgi:hypothetical protein